MPTDLFENAPAIVQEHVDPKAVLREIEAEFKTFERAGREVLDTMRRIGSKLAKVKNALGHGLFEPWVKKHCPFSTPTARRYMAAHREAGKSTTVVDLEDALRDSLTATPGKDEEPGDGGEVPRPGAAKTTAAGGKKNPKNRPAILSVNAFNIRVAKAIKILNALAIDFTAHIVARGQKDTAAYHGWRRVCVDVITTLEKGYEGNRKALAKTGEVLNSLALDYRLALAHHGLMMSKQFMALEELSQEERELADVLGRYLAAAEARG